MMRLQARRDCKQEEAAKGPGQKQSQGQSQRKGTWQKEERCGWWWWWWWTRCQKGQGVEARQESWGRQGDEREGTGAQGQGRPGSRAQRVGRQERRASRQGRQGRGAQRPGRQGRRASRQGRQGRGAQRPGRQGRRAQGPAEQGRTAQRQRRPGRRAQRHGRQGSRGKWGGKRGEWWPRWLKRDWRRWSDCQGQEKNVQGGPRGNWSRWRQWQWWALGKSSILQDCSTAYTGKKGISILILNLTKFSQVGKLELEALDMGSGRKSDQSKNNTVGHSTQIWHGSRGSQDNMLDGASIFFQELEIGKPTMNEHSLCGTCMASFKARSQGHRGIYSCCSQWNVDITCIDKCTKLHCLEHELHVNGKFTSFNFVPERSCKIFSQT